MKKRSAKTQWAAAIWALCVLFAHSVAAQTVDTGNEFIRLGNANGSSVLINQEPAAYLGGNGIGGSLYMRDLTYQDNMVMNGEVAACLLGGPGHDGDIYFSDGVSPTVHLDGGDGLITLGGSRDDGDLIVVSHALGGALQLSGDTGTITNHLGGFYSQGNGLVKAWAEIYGGDGSVAESWNCAGATRLAKGRYAVSFSPIGGDIRRRPRMATVLARTGVLYSNGGEVNLRDHPSDNSKIVVETRDSNGDLADYSFYLLVF